MSNTVNATYRVVLSILAALICIGNAFTIFVFWNQRRSLKRACFLLQSLAVADFLVGATELIDNATDIPDSTLTFHGDLEICFAVLFSCTSVFSLLVISLERAYAVVWPFRHRVAGTRVYVISIFMVWAAGLCEATVNGLGVYHIVSESSSLLFTSVTLFVCLCTVLVTYIAIRARLKRTIPASAVETNDRKLIEQNIKLSKTMFVVIGLSFGFWLPAITLYVILAICDHCLTGIKYVHAFSIVTVLHFANSLVNPIVYSYRMPMFKVAMKKLLRKASIASFPM